MLSDRAWRQSRMEGSRIRQIFLSRRLKQRISHLFFHSFYSQLIVIFQILMNFSQQLYSEFLQRRRSKGSSNDSHIMRRRTILRAFLDLPDQQLVTLESSISLLRRLSLIKCLQSVEDIVAIMQRKRRSAGQWGSEQELNQCRIIYFIWAVVEQEHLEMREFKQLILTLAQEQGRMEAIRSAYGEKEGIEQLLQSWDSLMLSAMEDRNDPQQSISNLSIIKSKNEGVYDSNKQNISYFQEEDVSTNRNNNKRTSHLQNTNSSNSLEKSKQRRESRSKLNVSRSNGKIAGRKSETNTIAPSSGVKACSFVTESLSTAEENNLVARLYRCDQYRQRQEQKKQIQQQRIKAELQECSFKPRIDRTRALSRGKGQVKGYEKAINRMKSGYKKNKQLKQNLEYRIWPSKATPNSSNSRISAPKFLSRVKETPVQLFQIVFTIGRHSIRVKIRQSDKVSEIVGKIGQIYALKEDSREYIRGIIEEELNSYYQVRCREENEEDVQDCSNQ